MTAPATRIFSLPLRLGAYMRLRDFAAQRHRSMAHEARVAVEAHLRDRQLAARPVPRQHFFLTDAGGGP